MLRLIGFLSFSAPWRMISSDPKHSGFVAEMLPFNALAGKWRIVLFPNFVIG